MVTIISFGDRLPGWTGPIQEGGEFNIDSGGPRLKIGFVAPRREEIRAFREGRVEVGIVRAGTHTAFFLYKIAGLSVGWCDASYALGLVDPDYRHIDPRKPNEGWLISSYFFDANTGIVRALRVYTISPAFSNILDTIVEDQRAALPGFTREKHYEEIAEVQRKFPTPNDLAPYSLLTETAGISFPKRV